MTNLIWAIREASQWGLWSVSCLLILQHRTASWAEERATKAIALQGAGRLQEGFHTTDNIFILRSLIDKQK